MTRPPRRWLQFGFGIGALLMGDVFAEARIESVRLEPVGGTCHFEARLNFTLSGTAIETLHSGIPLHWHFELLVRRADTWPWRTQRLHWQLHRELRYLALLNLYQITTVGGEDSNHYLTLGNALEKLGRIRQTLDCQTLIPQETYHAALRVRFDREALPLPLRPWAYLEPAWQLSSPWYSWRIH